MSPKTTNASTSRLIVKVLGTFQNRAWAGSAISEPTLSVVEDRQGRGRRLLPRFGPRPPPPRGDALGAGDQVVPLGRDDLAGDQVTGLERSPLDVRQTVDVGRVGERAAEPEVPPFRRGAVDQHVE